MKKQIIIIGGGIVGSTAAFYLSQASNSEVILIDNGVGTATRAAAGIICPWLSQRRNKDWYRLTSQGATFYLQLMSDLTSAGIANLPYQQTGTLVFKNKPALLEKLFKLSQERRLNAEMIGQLAIYQPEFLQGLIPELESDQGAVLTAGGGRVDGSKLLESLQKIFQINGGRIIKGKAKLVENQSVKVNNHLLQYDQVILACGAWLPELLAPLDYEVDIYPQKGQLLEVQTDLLSDLWPGCMLHGEVDILPFENGKIVIGASHENDMGHDLTVDFQTIADLKATATEFIPALEDFPISKTRVGTRAYTSDFLPFYGNLTNDPLIWVASGLGSSGLTSGPFIGWQLAQEIQGLEHCFDRSAYSPDKYIIKN